MFVDNLLRQRSRSLYLESLSCLMSGVSAALALCLRSLSRSICLLSLSSLWSGVSAALALSLRSPSCSIPVCVLENEGSTLSRRELFLLTRAQLAVVVMFKKRLDTIIMVVQAKSLWTTTSEDNNHITSESLKKLGVSRCDTRECYKHCGASLIEHRGCTVKM